MSYSGTDEISKTSPFLNMEVKLSKSIFIDFEAYYLRFSEATKEKRLFSSEGNGIFLSTYFHWERTKITLSYFYVDNFYCSQGNKLYWTTNEQKNENEYLQNIFLFYNYKMNINEKISFEFGLDNIYNLKIKELNYSYMLKISTGLEIVNFILK